MNPRIFFIFILSMVCLIGAQPLAVTTTVNQTQIVIDQQVVFTIELTGEAAQKVGQPELPDMQGYLAFLGSGGTAQNISFVNGKMSVSKSFSFYYLAAKEGTLTIPAVTVVYENEEYSSQPITLTITKGGTAGRPQGAAPLTADDRSSTDSDDLFIRTIVSKRRVYQNEPVIVTYRIYAAVRVTGYTITKLPEMTGFWTEDIETPQQPQVKNEVINGVNYVTADIKKVAIFPTSAGEKTIGPMSLQCEVKVQNTQRSRDLFDSFFDDAFFGRTIRKSIESPAVEIDVMSLPSADKPADFAGAVGQYKLNAAIDKTDVETNEAVTLKVTLSGTGNIRLLPRPTVIIPPDFERYDPKETENISRQNGLISGSKTFEYVLVPRFPGHQSIKPITFSYFDPKNSTYQTLTSPEIVINVAKGSGQFVAAGGTGLSKEEVKYVGQDIRFIKLTPGPLQTINYRIYTSFGFLSLLIVPLIVLGAAFAYKSHADKLSANAAYARSKRANAMAMRRLSKAKSLLTEAAQKDFYAEVASALTGFAADKLNMSKAGLMSDELEKEFSKKNIDSELTSEYFDLIRMCDFQRFAPSVVKKEEMDRSYKKARDVIIKLEKAL
ncbi:protein BatD [candidate division KSB1 bacterium]|nr:protein BatD [candidate division KSB1 bacterium]RQW04245.1 MAG: protein BatD [candidate division KSB1 bacterium]